MKPETLGLLRSPARTASDASDSPVHRPPEVTLYVARLHWRTLVPGLLVIAAAAVLWNIPVEFLRAWVTMLFGIADGSRLTLTTELVRVGALTLLGHWFVDHLRRVGRARRRTVQRDDPKNVLKTGVLRRRYFELPLDKVEAITVSQSMLARLFNYGTIVVAGTGSTREVIRGLAQPNEFRDHVMEQCEHRRIA